MGPRGTVRRIKEFDSEVNQRKRKEEREKIPKKEVVERKFSQKMDRDEIRGVEEIPVKSLVREKESLKSFHKNMEEHWGSKTKEEGYGELGGISTAAGEYKGRHLTYDELPLYQMPAGVARTSSLGQKKRMFDLLHALETTQLLVEEEELAQLL